MAVLLIVGGATWREYSRAKAVSAAQDVGDQISAALTANDAADRAAALADISASEVGAKAVVDFAQAAALADAGELEKAASLLDAVAQQSELPQVYRDIAAFKSVILQAETMPVEDRRLRLETLAAAGGSLQFLASEQLALLDIEAGDTDAALARLKEIAARLACRGLARARLSSDCSPWRIAGGGSSGRLRSARQQIRRDQ